MNPWLQRFLISLAAGAATSGVVVSTAKKPHRLKKRKKKRDKDGNVKVEPVAVGAIAMHDAKLPEERGLTVGEWRDAVVARGKSVAGVFKRAPKPGAGKEPDEIEAKDGTTVKKKRRRRRRGEKRPQATLWDSAKESLKQTVKETVREEVKQTAVGGAFEKLKNVGAKVKEGASAALDSAQKAAKNAKLDEKLKDARSAIEAAVTVAQGGDKTEKPAALDDGGTPTEPIEPDAIEPSAPEQPPAETAKRVADAVGSWLEGPGSPHYGKRVRPASGGDVVEAKDAPSPTAPAPAPAPSPTTPTEADTGPIKGEIVDDADKAAE